MKDYKLSEIKEICEKQENCLFCEIHSFCISSFVNIMPKYWEINQDEKEYIVIEETNYCEKRGELVITRFDVVEEKADETDKVGE